MLTKIRTVVFLLLCGLLTACATSGLNPNSARPGSDEAVVLVGVKSDIPLLAAVSYTCPLVCEHAHDITGQDTVIAVSVSANSSFSLDRVHTMDSRVARLSNKIVLEVGKPGVYWYGTIVASHTGAGVVASGKETYLPLARRKFALIMAGMVPVNFAWPNVKDDERTAYQTSSVTQASIAGLKSTGYSLGEFNAKVEFSSLCRGLAVQLTDERPFQDSFRLALRKELQTAGLEERADASVKVDGTITQLEFSSNLGWWKMGAILSSNNGTRVEKQIVHDFPTAWNGAEACRRIQSEEFNATRKLIDVLSADPAFARLFVPAKP